MHKATILFLTILGTCFLSLSWSCEVYAETVLLWQNNKGSIYGSLPDSWKAMESEELEAFSKVGKELLHKGTGDFVSGFRLKNEQNSSGGPYILVFANREERVSREQMQKTYSWFAMESRSGTRRVASVATWTFP